MHVTYMSPKEKLFPETACGGFSRVDGTMEFYSRIAALLRPDMTVLNFGAGRGAYLEDRVPYRRQLCQLRGRVSKVVAADVDPAVRENADVDEALVVAENAPLPFADESFDLIVSDFVFEHIATPVQTAAELARVLKPGGYICARTPNKWGYVGLCANSIPNAWHHSLLRVFQPNRQHRDVFPTEYHMNTRRALRRLFPPDAFEHFTYAHNPEPAYSGNSELLWRLTLLGFRLLPDTLGTVLLIFLRKRDRAEAKVC
jgi:Methylase involved in ubiquinone/menaquinone biosynthesis